MSQPVFHLLTIPEECVNQRLDQALALLLPDSSRSRLKQWIIEGKVKLEGVQPRPRYLVKGGEQVEVLIEPDQAVEWQPEALEVAIVFEDEDIFVINKPMNLVVHPAVGNFSGTLVNGLLHRVPALASLPRAGIVHRLDKDTTGLMVVAKNLSAYTSLVRQLQARTVSRTYWAIVFGVVVPCVGTVRAPIGRDPRDRKRMAVVSNGRHAVTHYQVLQQFKRHALVELCLETGRTHQIRVHMASLKRFIVGDKVYGGHKEIAGVGFFPRQALHAKALSFLHPRTGKQVKWETSLPDDMAQLLEALEKEE